MSTTTKTRPLRHATRLAIVAASVVLIAACGGDTESADEASTAATTTAASDQGETSTNPADTATAAATTASEASGTVVEVATTDLGDILVDGEGMTLYVFDNDDVDTSACTEGCLGTWPALVAESVSAGDGVSAELGTFTRADGDAQVTANGLPLYTYAADTAAGDVAGQGVGGVWWVVDPAGTKITETAVGSATIDEGGYGDPNT